MGLCNTEALAEAGQFWARREDLAEKGLFDQYRGKVLPAWIDYNGHMNVAYYLLAFDHATDLFFDALGLGDAHRETERCTTFGAEIHLAYLRELKQDDPIRVTTQLLSFDEKRFRFFHRMYHDGAGFEAATMEGISLHVHMDRRKVTPFPPHISASLAARFAAQGDLPLPDSAGRGIQKPPLAGNAE